MCPRSGGLSSTGASHDLSERYLAGAAYRESEVLATQKGRG